jgi:hypothetical protein
MLDRFAELIQNLSTVFQMPLHVDRHHACAIQVRRGLIVQLQSDAAQEKVLLTCKIIAIPPGKFRERVLREALKANGKADPLVGILAYVRQTNHLFLFQRYPFDILNGERIAGLIGPFIDTAEQWRQAIEKGLPAPSGPVSSGLPNPFGLKP